MAHSELDSTPRWPTVRLLQTLDSNTVRLHVTSITRRMHNAERRMPTTPVSDGRHTACV